MIYLLHGDYQLASRNFLKNLTDQAKKNGVERIWLDGTKLDQTDLIQNLTSNSLFGGEKLVIIENLFSRLKSAELERIFAWLKKYEADDGLIFWEKKPIGKILQRNLPAKTQVKEFKTPVIIFKLVEQITPQTKSQALQTLETALINEPAEFIFAMIVRQIRLLLLLAEGEKVSGAPWMLGKWQKQAQAFNKDELLTSYRKLYMIDKSIKTGQTIMPLAWHLAIWLAQL
ncbi:hypothetical protein GYA49_04890 [Candidatus Beckwithbacteria bacterium]|nr:hypothetical protein [Candidatus Beckwithbacteria bacterium]